MTTADTYNIIAKDRYVATMFAENNNIQEWVYVNDRKDIVEGAVVIVLDGWVRSRCMLQQAVLQTKLQLITRQNRVLRMSPSAYLAELI